MAELDASWREPAQTPLLAITGGEIVERGHRRRADIALIDGCIVAVEEPGSFPRGQIDDLDERQWADWVSAARSGEAVLTLIDEIDATGCVIASGFVDLCARVVEPPSIEQDVMQITTMAAAMGGFTALVAQPDTEPPLDRLGQLAELRRLAESAPSCHIVPAAALTVERAGARLAPLAEMASAGVCWFTDVGPQLDWGLLVRALQYASPLGVTVAVRPSGVTFGVDAPMHEGTVSARMGIAGEPAEAEHAATAAAISAASCTGGRLHLDRISAAGTVELVRSAKADGLNVSASVTADHLLFIDADAAGFDPLMRAEPPYRTAADRQALAAGVNDRTIDAVVSAHTPLAAHDKDLPFSQAPPGFASLETCAAIVLGHPDIELDAALDALAWRPAELAGVTHLGGGPIQRGQPANLVVIDLDRPWSQGSRDKTFARVSPHLGRCFDAQVIETIIGGARAVRSGYPRMPDELATERALIRAHSRWLPLVPEPVE